MRERKSEANILIVGSTTRKIVALHSGKRWVIGRSAEGDVDIVFDEAIVSRVHGEFYSEGEDWYYHDLNSSNGTFIDEYHVYHEDIAVPLKDGTVLRIDDERSLGKAHSAGILIYFFYGNFESRYDSFPLNKGQSEITIGRAKQNDIVLDTITASRKHGVLYRDGGRLMYKDLGSTSGTYLNSVPVSAPVEITPKDVLIAGNIKLIYTGDMFIYTKPDAGSYLTIKELSRVVNDSDRKGQKKTILNDVNVGIQEGKLVAVLGGSGAGKTTFMHCVIGYEKATSGTVEVDGINILNDEKLIKDKIGYVPQDDLLRPNLTTLKTLDYIGRIRLPKDVNAEDRKNRIISTLRDLDLPEDVWNSQIRKLSGGQRKRVSVASELISDPPLMFLDEPTSGLDPETETKFVRLMKRLAHNNGKTMIVVTHTIRNIMDFDIVLFFGPGGKLCFSGSPQSALNYFGVTDFVDIYDRASKNTDVYSNECREKNRRRLG